MSEFDIIHHYFASQIEHRPDVCIGIGDDAAVVKPPKDHELVMTTDTLIEGTHFPEHTLPYNIGYKSLAVNLSDLAAMGAEPAWAMLAISFPAANEAWLRAFCEGFFTLANRYRVQLIGGDTTKGNICVTVQAIGFVPTGQAILRSQAKPGDLIYVTGTLGDAGLALQQIKHPAAMSSEDERFIFERFHRPEPRLQAGEHLRGLASAAIDISDGLAADLGHILKQSQAGASINVEKLPLSQAVSNAVPMEKALELALTAGDDYELCFTVPPQKREALEKKLSLLPCRFTLIGVITEETSLQLHYQNGNPYHGPLQGYQHF